MFLSKHEIWQFHTHMNDIVYIKCEWIKAFVENVPTHIKVSQKFYTLHRTPSTKLLEIVSRHFYNQFNEIFCNCMANIITIPIQVIGPVFGFLFSLSLQILKCRDYSLVAFGYAKYTKNTKIARYHSLALLFWFIFFSFLCDR